MEGLVVDPEFWAGKRVLVTGHTGFKGAWLSFWLSEMGAEVTGLALPPPGTPNLYDLLGIQHRTRSVIGDINDRTLLDETLAAARPDVVLHLAAQALVRHSYEAPVSTVATNVLGVANILDAIRAIDTVGAVVIVTSDKCYENREWVWGYRETDPMGGHDPYSASKGCAEIIAASMRRSFFKPYAPNGHSARIATVRAGNVIGGGDWSTDRLVPDIVRGLLGDEKTVHLRHPQATRPWQHVMEPVAAYIGLAQHLLRGAPGVDDAWNFGPDDGADQTVFAVASAMQSTLAEGQVVVSPSKDAPHEAHLLKLDCSKVRTRFGWRPTLSFDDAIQATASWYRAWRANEDLVALTRSQLSDYIARSKGQQETVSA